MVGGLEISVFERGDVVVVELKGSADISATTMLESRLAGILGSGRNWIVMDLSGLTFTSSVGLGSLIRTHIRCRDSGGGLAMVNPQPAVMKVFKTTRLNELFELYGSVNEALEGIKVKGSDG